MTEKVDPYKMNTSYITLDEILSQPHAWQDALDELNRQSDMLRQLGQQQVDDLLFVGCGSPYFMARSAASMARALTGLPAEAHPASDIWLFPEQTLSANRSRLVVVISRSGETTETMRAVEKLSAQANQTIAAVTCYEASTLAKSIESVLLARAGQEVGLAQTRSFTSMLILTQSLIHAVGGRSLGTHMHSLPSLAQGMINQYGDFAEEFGRSMSKRFNRIFFLGGGALYGLACEAMLKMKEMSLSLSEAYHTMEFRHGPMSMANEETLIVGLVSENATAFETAVLSEMRQKGATVLAVTPTSLPAESADHQIVLPGGFSDVERGPLYLPVLHLIIYYHTVQKGLNPDLPHNLTAVINLDDDHGQKRGSSES
jgi:glutamine---fructose-6-phosphate transaminase (isomerizing)